MICVDCKKRTDLTRRCARCGAKKRIAELGPDAFAILQDLENTQLMYAQIAAKHGTTKNRIARIWRLRHLWDT